MSIHNPAVLSFDPTTGIVTSYGQIVELTPIERLIFKIALENAGKVMVQSVT